MINGIGLTASGAQDQTPEQRPPLKEIKEGAQPVKIKGHCRSNALETVGIRQLIRS
jgi:hypothetical protein